MGCVANAAAFLIEPLAFERFKDLPGGQNMGVLEG